MYVQWQKTTKIHCITYIIPRARNTSVSDSLEYLFLSSLDHLLFHSWAEDVTMPQEERRLAAFTVWHKLHLYNLLFTFETVQYSNHDHGCLLLTLPVAGRTGIFGFTRFTCKDAHYSTFCRLSALAWLVSGDEGMVLTEKRRRRCCSGGVIY